MPAKTTGPPETIEMLFIRRAMTVFGMIVASLILASVVGGVTMFRSDGRQDEAIQNLKESQARMATEIGHRLDRIETKIDAERMKNDQAFAEMRSLQLDIYRAVDRREDDSD